MFLEDARGVSRGPPTFAVGWQRAARRCLVVSDERRRIDMSKYFSKMRKYNRVITFP